MVFSKATLMALAVTLLSPANAHMVISNPIPYGQGSLNNSPLENSGSDFPCKQRPGVYDITKMNVMAVGVPQKLTFMGGATHGGGSCQVSVTLDQTPTKESQWKVIKSIIGGCPASVDGNLGGSATGTGASQFEFTLPQGMPNGQYSLAWTWFNKIGNREMYMNCAPIEVTGGSNDQTVYNSLPNMFVANLPREECETPAGTNVIFPNPGKDVQTVIAANPGTVSGSGCARQTNLGAGAGNAGTPALPTSPAQPPSSSAPASQPSTTNAPGLFPEQPQPTATSFATVTSTRSVNSSPPASSSSPASTQPPASSQPPASTQPPASSQPPASTQPATPPSTGNCPTGYQPCASPNTTVCYSLTTWGTCDMNNCAYVRSTSAGVHCKDGEFVHASRKRDIRHLAARRHGQHSF